MRLVRGYYVLPLSVRRQYVGPSPLKEFYVSNQLLSIVILRLCKYVTNLLVTFMCISENQKLFGLQNYGFQNLDVLNYSVE